MLPRMFLVTALLLPSAALAQNTPEPTTITADDNRNKPKEIGPGRYQLDMVDRTLYEFTTWVADLKRMNFVIGDPKDLKNKKVTIISHKPVSAEAVYEAYLAALEVNGFSLSRSGTNAKIVKSTEAAQNPIQVNTSKSIPYTDQIITQLIPLENISVSDVNSIVTGIVSKNAKVVAYNPSNTLIITDVAHNLRKVYQLLSELDVAAPKATLEIVPVIHADAAEIKTLIEELYGTEEQQQTTTTSRTSRRRTRRSRAKSTSGSADAQSAGKASKYINKVLADERTNALIVLANEQGHQTVRDLLDKLDVDPEGLNESRIYVVRLENAKAEEVAQVLSKLSDGGGSTNTGGNARTAAARAKAAAANKNNAAADADGAGAIAAFDSGMRIASDENTNALVIIAKPADYEVVKRVIDELDMERRQVFVDATILEISSEDRFNLGVAAHLPTQPSANATGFVGGQFNGSSFGLASLAEDALSGLAVGVFGPSVTIPGSALTGGTDLSIPAFGIALNALRTNSGVNIVSNPTLMTLDNEEAEIIVGRKVPFPTQVSGLGGNLGGIPIQSFQREDVAITLAMTPRINSSNMVTLELEIEVAEIEDGTQGNAGGPTTSNRKVKTVVLVGDNQTAVLGGLVSNTDSQVETKFPVLGDLPVIGALFRGKTETSRKTNLMVFLTPHIIDDPEDIIEVQRVKEAQRQEFLRRFYGKSRDKQLEELRKLMQYSMNYIDEPSVWRGPVEFPDDWEDTSEPMSEDTRKALEEALNESNDNLAVPESGEGQ